MAVFFSHPYSDKSRHELISEIIEMNKELAAKELEIKILRKKLAIYRSLK
jgi:hypothetical protein